MRSANVFAPLALVLGVAGSYGNPRGIIPESVEEAQKALWIAQHGYSTGLCVLLVAYVIALSEVVAIPFEAMSDAPWVGDEGPVGVLGAVLLLLGARGRA